MSDRTRVTLARSVAAFTIMAVTVGSGIFLSNGLVRSFYQSWILHNGFVAVAMAVITWIVIPRQPRNRTVWITTWSALCGGLYVAIMTVGTLQLLDLGLSADYLQYSPSELPGHLAVLFTVGTLIYVPNFFLVPLALLFFPDGKLLGRRWRLPVVVAAIGMVSVSVGTVIVFPPEGFVAYGESNFDLYPSAGLWLWYGGGALVVMGFIAAIASLFLRHRRSRGDSRQQLRWLGLGQSVLVVMVLLMFAIDPSDSTGFLRMGWLVAFGALFGSYGVALAKYRLYDVDLVISRTVVFGVLALFITASYAFVVVGLGSLLGTGTSDLTLSIATTAVVALLFEPIRGRAQSWANRLVFGVRAAPFDVLADLTGQLAHSEVSEGLLERMARLLADGTGAERTSVWIAESGGFSAVSGWPDFSHRVVDSLDALAGTVIPITGGGQVRGALLVETRKAEPLNPTERRLAEDLAGSAGLVIEKLRLDTALQARAGELTDSRLRLLEAHDVERLRLERALEEGTQQEMILVQEALDGVLATAREERADRVIDLVARLAEEAEAAISQIRALALGIYPPLLRAEGLARAVRGLAEGAPGEVSVEVEPLLPLPADTEATLYFVISEALTNAIKYGGGAPITIRLNGPPGVVEFEVKDEGPGFDLAAASRGVGMRNMRDRIDSLGGDLVMESTAAGTRVAGRIPVAVAPSPG